MAYKKTPKGHTEFGGGPGLIDPERRAGRVIGQEATPTGYQNLGEELMEIYATDPAKSDSKPEETTLERP